MVEPTTGLPKLDRDDYWLVTETSSAGFSMLSVEIRRDVQYDVDYDRENIFHPRSWRNLWLGAVTTEWVMVPRMHSEKITGAVTASFREMPEDDWRNVRGDLMTEGWEVARHVNNDTVFLVQLWDINAESISRAADIAFADYRVIRDRQIAEQKRKAAMEEYTGKYPPKTLSPERTAK